MSLDLCVSYTPGHLKAMKFTDYVKDTPHNDVLTRVYTILDNHGYHCPDVYRLHKNQGQGQGISLKWENDGSSMIITIYFNDIEHVYCVLTDPSIVERHKCRVDKLEEFLETE